MNSLGQSFIDELKKKSTSKDNWYYYDWVSEPKVKFGLDK